MYELPRINPDYLDANREAINQLTAAIDELIDGSDEQRVLNIAGGDAELVFGAIAATDYPNHSPESADHIVNIRNRGYVTVAVTAARSILKQYGLRRSEQSNQTAAEPLTVAEYRDLTQQALGQTIVVESVSGPGKSRELARTVLDIDSHRFTLYTLVSLEDALTEGLVVHLTDNECSTLTYSMSLSNVEVIDAAANAVPGDEGFSLGSKLYLISLGKHETDEELEDRLGMVAAEYIDTEHAAVVSELLDSVRQQAILQKEAQIFELAAGTNIPSAQKLLELTVQLRA